MFTKSSVLIVDDSSIQRLAWIMEFAKCAGVMPVTARDGQEALAIAKQRRPDLLVTDLDMPVMDGEALVHELKALYPEMVILVVTGTAKPKFRVPIDTYPNVYVFDKENRYQAMQTAYMRLGASCAGEKSKCANASCANAKGRLQPPVRQVIAQPA